MSRSESTDDNLQAAEAAPGPQQVRVTISTSLPDPFVQRQILLDVYVCTSDY